MNPFAFNYWSCLNLPTLKNKNGGIQDGGQLIQRDRQTQNPFGYLSVGVKPSTAVIGPFSHTSKRRFSCRNSGRAAIKKIFKTFLWYLREFLLCLDMTMKENENNESIIFLTTLPHSSFLFTSVFYNLFNIIVRCSPSGQSGFLMWFLRLTPDWTELMRGLWFTRWHIVCSCIFWQSDPIEYWDERPAWIFRKKKERKKKKKCEISWNECVAYLSPSVLDWMCSGWRQTSYCCWGAVMWYCQ